MSALNRRLKKILHQPAPVSMIAAELETLVREREQAAAEKAYERGRLDERHDCNITSLYHGSVISAEQLQRDLRSGNPYRTAALGLTAKEVTL